VLREDKLLFMNDHSFFNLITQQGFIPTCFRLPLKYALRESLETSGTEFTLIASVPLDVTHRICVTDDSACLSRPLLYFFKRAFIGQTVFT
jgi:hypothetical protein